MKSVGEVMAIGRTFKEALQKGIRSLEPSTPWRAPAETPDSLLREKLATPRPDRIHWLLTAVERGLPAQEICALTKIDPWFILQIEEIIAMNRRAAKSPRRRELLRDCETSRWRRATRADAEDHGGPVRLQRARYGRRFQASRYLRGLNRLRLICSTYEDEDESEARAAPIEPRAEPHRAGIEFGVLLPPRCAA
jgi:hypothetical protein